ncbi:uncharacterized protein LOC101862942 [Aplysia californica]|uniref:Uncharacterized protein LOC101862942 n=1 Tax=Aplysia californica TaxID=6500 RepID=A0ABM1VSR9_APLCA|nr:uncharacterized protein LOC101862942 [Aplysia californica]
MAFPSPTKPDIINFSRPPPLGKNGKGIFSRHVDGKNEVRGEEERKKIGADVLLGMVEGALRRMEREHGSTLQDIRRHLVSGQLIHQRTDIRPAVILGLRKGRVVRAAGAVEAGLLGRYEVREVRGGQVKVKPQWKAKVRGRRAGATCRSRDPRSKRK